jgi:dihydrofolate synthase/folylpolyglutamate synthase
LPEAEARIAEVAQAVGARIRRAGCDYPPSPVAPALAGAHQLANAALAVALARQAAQALGRPLDDASILDGILQVRWPGRLERLAKDVLLDCAHNVEGAMALAAALPAASRRVLVTSIVRDKNAAGILNVLSSRFDRVVVTRSPSERAMEPVQLAGLVNYTKGGGRDVVCVDDPALALAQARAYAGDAPDGLVVVAGSIFLVGALRSELLGNPQRTADASDPLP